MTYLYFRLPVDGMRIYLTVVRRKLLQQIKGKYYLIDINV